MIIACILLCIVSLFLLYKSYTIKIEKRDQLQKIQTQISEQKHLWEQQEKNQKEKILILHQQQNKLKKQIDDEVEEKRYNLNILFDNLKEQSSKAFSFYEKNLDNCYKEKEDAFNQNIQKLQRLREQAQGELDQVKASLAAAAAAQLREQEVQQKLKFYQIQIGDKPIKDIIYLQDLKTKLYEPSIVSKVIWSTYIMKPTTEMCNRVLGSATCGIYKITDLITKQCYIGQSVNLPTRWKDHVKCGLGIEASPTNKLYNAMQRDGVWNFTFQLLQECSRDKLNQKERFWIEMYQADTLGFNSTKGNK